MPEVIRTRCPFCGLMPEVERVLGTDDPAEVVLYLQRFGGRIALSEEEKAEIARAEESYELERATRASRKGRRRKFGAKAKGVMEYTEIDDPGLKRQVVGNFKRKAEKLLRQG